MSLSPNPPPERKLAERTEDPMHSEAWWAGGECSFPVCECVDRCAMEPTRRVTRAPHAPHTPPAP